MDTFFLSQKTKSSVPPKPWDSQGKLVVSWLGKCLTGQNRTKTGQGRAGRCRMMTGEAAFLGFSPSDILVDGTGVSVMPISPICKGSFVWLNFV